MPRFASVPPADVSLGDEAVDFAAKAGLHLDPWQRMVLRESLGLVKGGKWAARNVGLLVPRQNGKGAVLEARELFGLFVLNEKLIIHSAHKFDTSQEHYLRMKQLIEGNPDLDQHVLAMPTANGKEAILLRNGSRLKFKARTVSGSGRGFSSDLLVLDEAMLLPDQALAAMLPTLITRPNPQVWYTSSAGTPESTALWRLVKRGRANAERMAYFEWGCESGTDPSDREQWALANPGLGYRLPVEELEQEFFDLAEADFTREHLGIWDDAASSTVIPLDIWDGLADLSATPPRPSGKVAFSVDTTWTRSRSSISVAGVRPDGHPQVQVVENRGDVTWVVGRLKDLTAKDSLGVVIDMQSAAASLVDDLRDANVEIIEMTTSDAKQSFGQFFDSAIDRRLRHLDQPELNSALKGATTRTVGDALLWDRKKATDDITPLVSATNALWGWTTRQSAGKFQGSVF